MIEAYHVWWVFKIPVLVGPEFACCSNTGLYFVHDHQNVVLACQCAKASEEVRRGVVVSALTLDGFDDDGDGWVVVRCD